METDRTTEDHLEDVTVESDGTEFILQEAETHKTTDVAEGI